VRKYPSIFSVKTYRKKRNLKVLRFKRNFNHKTLSKALCSQMIKQFPEILRYNVVKSSLAIIKRPTTYKSASISKFGNPSGSVKGFHRTNRRGLKLLTDPFQRLIMLNRALEFVKNLSLNQGNILFIISDKDKVIAELIKLHVLQINRIRPGSCGYFSK
jgi:hypothetical protein